MDFYDPWNDANWDIGQQNVLKAKAKERTMARASSSSHTPTKGARTRVSTRAGASRITRDTARASFSKGKGPYGNGATYAVMEEQ